MSDETDNENNEQDVVQQLTAFVVAEMQAGSDKATIAQKLIDQGIDRGEAEQFTGAVYDEVAGMVAKEQFSPAAIGPGLVGGIIAALLGGGVWAGIAIFAEYEIGIIAWGIGGLCGYGVVMAAGGRKGLPLQVIAVLTGVFGIAAGKFFTFYFIVKQSIEETYGAEAAASFQMTSPDTISMFMEALPEMASPYDILWVLLAVITAWRIPKSSGITLPQTHTQGPITPA